MIFPPVTVKPITALVRPSLTTVTPTVPLTSTAGEPSELYGLVGYGPGPAEKLGEVGLVAAVGA